ncbi:MAG: hypothetical protein AAGC53_06905 [Actinomycetota bacterium]
MKIEAKVRARIEGDLEPNEEVHAVFLAQVGINPWWFMLSALFGLVGAVLLVLAGQVRPRIVAVTSEGTRVWSASMWVGGKPKQLLSLAAHQPFVVEPGFIYSKTEANGEAMWLHKNALPAVNMANGLIAQTG